jgi:hypothetical protein
MQVHNTTVRKYEKRGQVAVRRSDMTQAQVVHIKSRHLSVVVLQAVILVCCYYIQVEH